MKKYFLLYLLAITFFGTIVTPQTWKQYIIKTNTTNFINFTTTSTSASDFVSGSWGALNNLSSDTSRQFHSPDLINDVNAYPWRVSVKFNNVSGVLIDPYHVLTAGHCVSLDPGFGNVQFYPGYSSGDFPFGYAYAEVVYLLNDYCINTGRDLAIIKLDRPIGFLSGWSGYGYNNDESFYYENKFYNPSYPSVSPYDGLKLYNWKGSIDYCSQEYLYSFRNGYIGMSGSPGFSYFNYLPVAYGIVISTGVKFNKITPFKFDALKAALMQDLPQTPDAVPLKCEVYPQKVNPNTNIDSVSFYIANYSQSTLQQGTLTAKVYASSDSIINENDNLLSTYIISQGINSLSSIKIKLSNIPVSNLSAGNYRIGLIISGDNNTVNNTTDYRDMARMEVSNNIYFCIRGNIYSPGSHSSISGIKFSGLESVAASDCNGNYFAYLPQNYNGVITPLNNDYNFSPSSVSISNLNSDTTVNFTATKKTVNMTISLKSPIASLPVSGVQADGLPQEIYSTSGGLINCSVLYGWSGNVSLYKDGWTINQNNYTFSNLTSNFMSNSIAGFCIFGYLYKSDGNVFAYTPMTGFPQAVQTDAYGKYCCMLDSGWSGTIQPVINSVNFNPGSYTYSNLNYTQMYQDFSEAAQISFRLKVFLSGAYENDTMNTKLAYQNFLPANPPDTFSSKTQPFIVKHTSLRSINPTCTPFVDWICIEVIDGGSLAPVDTLFAIVNRDGDVVNPDGSDVLKLKPTLNNGYYYLIIRHRNHLAVMTNDAYFISSNKITIDLTTSPASVYGGQLMQLKTGLYGLYAGDVDYNGSLNEADFQKYQYAVSIAKHGYVKCDLNLDGYVTAHDFNIFAPNNKLHLSTQIPDLSQMKKYSSKK